MLVRASKFLAVLFLSQLLLAGCSSRKGIFVTLLMDYSGSNIAVNERSKIPQKICKDIVRALTKRDYFTFGKFDSVFSNPQSLRQVNKISTKPEREVFANRQCPNLLRKSPDLNHPDGTDAYAAWSVFYQAYEERRRETTGAHERYTEVVFFVIDALEQADQGKKQIDFTNLKESISRFVGGGNKVIFFVNREPDHDSLASKLLLQGIEIHPYDGNFKSTIESTYSAARDKSSVKTSN